MKDFKLKNKKRRQIEYARKNKIKKSNMTTETKKGLLSLEEGASMIKQLVEQKKVASFFEGMELVKAVAAHNKPVYDQNFKESISETTNELAKHVIEFISKFDELGFAKQPANTPSEQEMVEAAIKEMDSIAASFPESGSLPFTRAEFLERFGRLRLAFVVISNQAGYDTTTFN